MNINQPLFFIHIPKTAGSSFRVAAEQLFGKELVYSDYGRNAKETHPDIKEFEYTQNDRYKSGSAIKSNAKLLTGHVNFNKYAPFFSPKNTFTFVREPSQQVASHFSHFTRLHGYKGSFEDFIKEKRFSNMQSKALGIVWREALGVLGVTERYEESLNLINSYYGLQFPLLDINKNTEKSDERYEISEEQMNLIRCSNELDFELYNYADERLTKQISCLHRHLPFIRFDTLPVAAGQQGTILKAWAVCYESSEPVELELYINGKLKEKLRATEYRARAKEWEMHRDGFIGVTYNYENNCTIGDFLEVKCPITHAVLYSETISRK